MLTSEGHSGLDADEQYQQQEVLELQDELVPETKKMYCTISPASTLKVNQSSNCTIGILMYKDG